jgi:hypothetical protein
VKWFSLSSWATGPKTQVPLGFPYRIIKTVALSLNCIIAPFLHSSSLQVETITALTISDFPKGIFGADSSTMEIVHLWLCACLGLLASNIWVHINLRAQAMMMKEETTV